MRSLSTIATLAVLAVSAPLNTCAFSGSFTGSQMKVVKNDSSMTMEYIPSGMSKEQWAKIKAKEASKTKGKDLGKVGITSFKSRSFSDWQKAGGKNLFPVDPRKVKDASEIPYMQRTGGAADGSDLGGANKKVGGGSFFKIGGKKKEEPKPEPEKPKPKNWWTL